MRGVNFVSQVAVIALVMATCGCATQFTRESFPDVVAKSNSLTKHDALLVLQGVLKKYNHVEDTMVLNTTWAMVAPLSQDSLEYEYGELGLSGLTKTTFKCKWKKGTSQNLGAITQTTYWRTGDKKVKSTEKLVFANVNSASMERYVASPEKKDQGFAIHLCDRSNKRLMTMTITDGNYKKPGTDVRNMLAALYVLCPNLARD